MAKLAFKVEADWQKVAKLRDEITRLKNDLRGMDATASPRLFKELSAQLDRLTTQFDAMVNRAARAGAAMEADISRSARAASQSMGDLNTQQNRYVNELQRVVRGNEQASLSFKNMLAAIGGIAVFKSLISNMVAVRSEFRRIEVGLETMIGKVKATTLLGEIKDYAKESPLDLKGISSATQMMIGFNIEAEKVPRYIRAIGDISQGDAGRFNSLSLAFSQMSAAGKLMGQDLNQMINAGFNPLSTMAEKTGKSISQLKDEMSKGAISAEMVQQAFIDATSEGGKFYNMSQAASKELAGQISMFRDAMDNAFNEMGEKSEGILMTGIQGATKLIQNYEQVGKVLISLIATYGAYRAALVVTNVLEAARYQATLAQMAGMTKMQAVMDVLRIKTEAFNKVLMKNPYALAAMAIVGIVTATWALYDSTTAAEKAQRRYNEAKEEAAKRDSEHKAKIDELIGAARDESMATLTRQKSLEELKREYPKIFSQYDIEKLKLADIMDLKRQINEENAKNTVQTTRSTYSTAKEKRDLTGEALSWGINDDISSDEAKRRASIRRRINELAGYQATTNEHLRRIYRDSSEEMKVYEKDLLADNIAAYKANLSNYSKEKLEAELRIAKSAASKRNGMNINGVMVKGSGLGDIIATLEGSVQGRKPDSSYQKDLESARKEWDDAKAALQKIESDKSSFTTEQYNKAKKDAQDKEKAYKDLGGITKEDTSKADAQRKLEEKNAQEILALRRKNSQAEVDLMADGSSKKIAQLELNYQNELEAIRKLEQQTGVTPETTVAAQLARRKRDDGVALVNKEDSDNEEKILNDLLDKYQDYEAKRLELENQYNSDVTALQSARTEANAAEIDKAIRIATEKYNNAQSQFRFDDLKDSINWEEVFGNLDKVPTEALKGLKEQLRAYIQEDNNLSPDNLKAIIEALDDIEAKEIERTPFRSLGEALTSLTDANKELKDAQQAYNEALAEGTQQEQADTKAKLDDAKASQQKAKANATAALRASVDKMKQYKEVADNILGITEELGIKTPEWLNGLMGGIDTVLSGLESIDLTKPMSVVTGNLTVVKGIIQSVGSFFGIKNDTMEKYVKLKEELEAINEIYDKIIAKSKENIFFGGGVKSINAYIEALEALERQEENYRKVAEAAGRSREKRSHSAAYKSNKSIGSEGFTAMSATVGKDIQSVQDLYNLSAEELYKIMTTNVEYWSQMDEKIREPLESIIEMSDAVEELKKGIQEAMTGVNFDSFYSDFINQLSNMETSYEDMCDNFEEMLRKSIIAGLISSKYQDRINKLYEDWANAANSDGIDKGEADRLKAEYEQAVRDMISDRDSMAKTFGWDTSSAQDQGSSRGFQSMSQDTGEELNGRFTAVHAAIVMGNEESSRQTESLNLLNMTSAEICRISSSARDIASEMRDIAIESLMQLRGINENTEAIIQPIKAIQSDIAQVKQNTSRL